MHRLSYDVCEPIAFADAKVEAVPRIKKQIANSMTRKSKPFVALHSGTMKKTDANQETSGALDLEATRISSQPTPDIADTHADVPVPLLDMATNRSLVPGTMAPEIPLEDHATMELSESEFEPASDTIQHLGLPKAHSHISNDAAISEHVNTKTRVSSTGSVASAVNESDPFLDQLSATTINPPREELLDATAVSSSEEVTPPPVPADVDAELEQVAALDAHQEPDRPYEDAPNRLDSSLQPLDTFELKPSKNRAAQIWIIAAVSLLLVGCVGIGIMIWRRLAATPRAAIAGIENPTSSRWRVASTPSGAKVLRTSDGRVLGRTPLAINLGAEEVLELVLVRDGYRKTPLSLLGGVPPVDTVITLQAIDVDPELTEDENPPEDSESAPEPADQVPSRDSTLAPD